MPGSGKPSFSTAEFDKMKQGVFVLNTARGGVIDEDASCWQPLIVAKVIGAGLDVFENEPTPKPC
ncbi:MAG: NAD(P)-dependent oxidoreductase [Saprospiraceae bacterium]